MKYLNTKLEDGILTLTINKPETLNALNSELLDELNEKVSSIAQCKDVRVMVITGLGKSFVAGADISEMACKDRNQGREFGAFGADLFRAIENLPMPVIAAVNGYALGGGCELALACDIRIASAKAKFGQPEVGLGITPGFSATVRLPKLVGIGMAKLLICTGKTIDAQEALRIGLVEMVASEEEFEATVYGTAKMIAANAPIAVQLSKKSINEGIDMSADAAIANEVELFADCFETKDQKEGMKAFLAKTKIQFKGE